MKITEVKISEIHPYKNNPRINDGAVDIVARSIKEFGWRQPIVVDKDGTIIAGHTRYKAAQKMGLETVPVIYAEDLTPEQVKAYRLVDNKSAELSEWDDDLLSLELIDLPIDMTQFGFDIINPDAFGEDFELNDGIKEPFQQMTFTLADEQAEFIRSMLAEAKEDNNIDTFGNTNGNGNALYRICREWEEQKI